VLVTARAVGVAVLGFIFSGLADIGNFHVKCQLHTGQGVIAIDIHIETADFKHGYLYLALLGLQIQNLPY
jgi:hypothetical protein